MILRYLAEADMGMHGDYTLEMDSDGGLSPENSNKLLTPESFGLVAPEAVETKGQGDKDPGDEDAATPLVTDNGGEAQEWLKQEQQKKGDPLPQRRGGHYEGSGIVAGAVVSSPVCMTASSDNLLKPWTFSYLYNLAIGIDMYSYEALPHW